MRVSSVTDPMAMQKYPVKAIITGDLNMLRSFARTGVPTVTVTSDPKDCVLLSRHVMETRLVPNDEIDETGAVEALIRLAGRCDDKPVLFYGRDRLMLLISRQRDVLLSHFRFNMPPPEIMEVCTDKLRFGAYARERGLPVPREIAVRGPEGLAALAERVTYPCILKSDYQITLEGAPMKVLRAANRAELDAAVRLMKEHTENFTVQEFIQGGEDAIHSYHAYINRQGDVVAEYGGRKIRTYPSFAGLSTYVELVRDEALMALGRDTAGRLGITGPVKIDFKKDPASGRYYLLEINLRFTLWNYLGTRAGINLPLLAYLDCCDLPCPRPVHYRTDLAWLSFGDDLRGFVRYYRPEGKLSTRRWLSSFLRPKVYDVFAWTDPLPSLVNGARFAVSAFRHRLGIAPCVTP